MNNTPTTPTFSEIIRSYPFRVVIYAVITFALFEWVYWAVGTRGADAIGKENGPVEMAQVVLAVIGAVGLFCAARWTMIGRAGLIVCASVVTYAAARESDAVFEALLFDDAYKWVVGLPLGVLCFSVIYAERRQFMADTMWLMRHPAATLFAIAGVYLCFVCQILDRPNMWTTVGDAEAVGTAKALVEEFAELFAYLLLAFSGFEAAVLARRGQMIASKAKRTMAPVEIYKMAA